eukprot:Blabericola_migrator_1__1943@NODE_1529_length_4336_cov_55_024127_g42_i2_p1_GENE_NODE_1529_length_4336_cov_55_024127_g42_i2NODE_1529_length_4336_cov_55_024127_g42_i2_p1_ORF_typecomplete_len673_score164_02BSD/PF03909_17/25BSD/PF03909_17/0_031_NODE_1529_length_4336_cov_55_024127_g42_i26442662
MEDEELQEALWRVSVKFSTSSKEPLVTGLIGITYEDGCIDFASDDGVETTWPLEGFVRHRKNPKLPMVQLQFKTDLSDERVFNRERSVDIYPAQLIVNFAPLAEGAAAAVDDFITKVLAARKTWLTKPEETTTPLDAKHQALHKYKCLLDQIQQEKASREAHVFTSRSEQLRVAKATALQIHSELALLHEDLVQRRRIISETEFWNRHADALARTLPLPSPEEEFYFPNPAALTDDGKPTEINVANCSILLSESEVINTKYEALVKTGKLSEQEFWSRLFKSRFYSKLAGLSSLPVQEEPYFDTDDLVEPTPMGLPADTALETVVSEIVPPNINMSNMDYIEKEGFGIRPTGDIVKTGTTPPSLAAYADQKMAKRTDFALFERFNRHAARALKSRKEMTALFSSGAVSTDPIESGNLGVLAALMSLEKVLDSSQNETHIEDTIVKKRREELEKSVILEDLTNTEKDEKDTVWENELPTKRLLRIPVSRPFDAAQYMSTLANEASQFNWDIDPSSHDALAKCCFVKFTNSLRGFQDKENEKFLQEVAQSPKLIDLFHRVADLQARVKETIYYVYNASGTSNMHSAILTLNEIKAQLNEIKQLEVSQHTGLFLCEPLTNPDRDLRKQPAHDSAEHENAVSAHHALYRLCLESVLQLHNMITPQHQTARWRACVL